MTYTMNQKIVYIYFGYTKCLCFTWNLLKILEWNLSKDDSDVKPFPNSDGLCGRWRSINDESAVIWPCLIQRWIISFWDVFEALLLHLIVHILLFQYKHVDNIQYIERRMQTHKRSQSSFLTQDPDFSPHKIQSRKLKRNHTRYSGQKTFYCMTPTIICSINIIQQAIFLWGTWELLSFLAPTEFVLCCTRKQQEAKHIVKCLSTISFPFISFFCSKDLSHSTNNHMAIMCVSVIFGRTIRLHPRFLY
jgi:hypothetical protein